MVSALNTTLSLKRKRDRGEFAINTPSDFLRPIHGLGFAFRFPCSTVPPSIPYCVRSSNNYVFILETAASWFGRP
jgi:hypothetical protein